MTGKTNNLSEVAAPDLLAALQAIMNAEYGPVSVPLGHAAQTAINKATGNDS